MAFTFDELIPVTLVTDAETPAELASFGGRIVMVPPDTPLPTDGSGILAGKFPGYARTANGVWQWVIGPAQDPVLRAVNRIPGAAGWNSVESRRVWRQVARQLRDAGVSSIALQEWLPQLYAAAITNHTTAPPA